MATRRRSDTHGSIEPDDQHDRRRGRAEGATGFAILVALFAVVLVLGAVAAIFLTRLGI